MVRNLRFFKCGFHFGYLTFLQVMCLHNNKGARPSKPMPTHMEPSIYDVQMEGCGQAQVDACGRGGGVSAMWTSAQKL